MTPTPIRASLSVTTEDAAQLTEVAEQFARTAAGLALSGVEAFVAIYPDRDDDPNPPR